MLYGETMTQTKTRMISQYIPCCAQGITSEISGLSHRFHSAPGPQKSSDLFEPLTSILACHPHFWSIPLCLELCRPLSSFWPSIPYTGGGAILELVSTWVRWPTRRNPVQPCWELLLFTSSQVRFYPLITCLIKTHTSFLIAMVSTEAETRQ